MISLEHIIAAKERITSGICHTPCEISITLSQILGADVYIKYENMQFTASFKERGALNKLLLLQSKGKLNGVVAMSAGNHAKAVAYHASALGIKSIIVMPRHTPNVKVEDTIRLGAEVMLKGDTLEESANYAHQLAKESSFVFVHPYDDEDIMAGQGTVAIEMLEDIPDLDIIVVPVGGGGLIAGMSVAAKTIKPSITVIGIESDTYPSVKCLLEGQTVVAQGSTLAEGIAVKHPGEKTLPVIKAKVDEMLLVTELAIEKAVSYYINIEKCVAEGAGAASLAAIIEHSNKFSGKKVGIVLSGANIDARILSYILMRDLVHEGRIIRLQVKLDDSPGSLSKVTSLVAECDGNIIDVDHKRFFAAGPVKETTLEMIVEIRNKAHANEIVTCLCQAGYSVTQI